MSLRLKVITCFLIVTVVYCAADYTLHRMILYPSFIRIENEQAVRNANRCVNALKTTIEDLNQLCIAWAGWDDARDFVQKIKPDFVQTNLQEDMFLAQKLNLIAFFDKDGKCVWKKCYTNLDAEPLESTNLAFFESKPSPNYQFLLNHPDTKSCLSGLLATEYGPMMISSRPISNSNFDGPVNGILIMGRFLTNSTKDAVSEQTEVTIEWTPLDSNSAVDSDISYWLGCLTPQNPVAVDRDSDKENVMSYTVFPGLNIPKALFIRAATSKDISRQGDQSLMYARISIIIGGTTTLLVLLVLVQRLILKPLSDLHRHAAHIAKTGDMTHPIVLPGKDELAQLAEVFNGMVMQLHHTKTEAMNDSYRAGASEMVNGLFHNAQDAFSRIKSQVDILRSQVDAMIPDSSSSEPSAYNNESYTESLYALKHGISILEKPITQLESTLLDQTALSATEETFQTFSLETMLKDCLAALHTEVRKNIQITFDPGISQIGNIQSNRFALSHILVNLLNNAAESIRAAGVTQGRISIMASVQSENTPPTVQISVIDNGKGIAETHLHRLFEKGYSTKTADKKKTGLHWCANTIRTLNGKIYAASDGPDKGAIFVVVFPKEPISASIPAK